MKAPNVTRFLKAHAGGQYDIALREIRAGRKRSHWVWFVFPQIHGLGHSQMSRTYALSSLIEAKAFWEDDSLRKNLTEITNALLAHDDQTTEEILGQKDAMKVRSCMTLFDIVSPHDIFNDVLENFYDGKRCSRTLQIVKDELEYYKQDSCIKRSGIQHPDKGFFEIGSHESNEVGPHKAMATFADLVLRGETMVMMVNHYLWHRDLSLYRVSGVEHTISYQLSSLLNHVAKELNNPLKVKNLVENCGAFSQMNNVWEYAETYDKCLSSLSADPDALCCLKTFIAKDSLMSTATPNTIGTQSAVTRPAYTPDKISSLKPDEIFVFGSNLKGQHGRGAARIAHDKFGAIMGKGVGLQGQSYAIPTMQGGVETIRPYVDEFIRFAKEHSELFFYVTRIGCGIADFKDEEMAPLFAKAIDMKNVCLPKSFADVIKNSRERRKNIFTHVHGITRTLADIVIERNKRKRFNSPNEVMEDLKAYFYRFTNSGDTVALSAIRAFLGIITENGIFTPSGLDVECFKSKTSDYQEMANQYDKAYFQYCLEVLYNLVVFLNEFRQYTNPIAVYSDINELRLCDASCGSTYGHSKFLLTEQIVAYAPLYYFENFLAENWRDIASNGILNAKLLNELMFNKHERGLRKYGLQAVLDLDYEQGGCRGDAYSPKRVGTGPIYVKKSSGKYTRSCGDGDHYSNPFPFEHDAAYLILDHDTRYEYIKGYFVPKSDMTLPVVDFSIGIVSFKSDEDKRKFIEDLKKED